MHDAAAEQSRGGHGRWDCRTRAGGLQRVVSGSEAFALVTQVPSQELREAMADERIALAESLAACANPGAAPPSTNLSAVTTDVQKRLVELGVRR
ncbi:MAG TPA: hypothetical protein VHY21_14695 [Pseudonocardiaceae bacterium]|jgi:hypothetical protein|nr:hypothetical protein [Pseudonocardiaceae bacterium]